MRRDEVQDTGVSIDVLVDGLRVGTAGLLSDGTWECHPEPVETERWWYRENCQEAFASLLDWYRGGK
jgi:hypothetical protein